MLGKIGIAAIVFGLIIAAVFGFSQILNAPPNKWTAPSNHTVTVNENVTINDKPSKPVVVTPPAGLPDSFRTVDMEAIVFELVNEDRTSRGLEPLTYDLDLALIAQEHSIDMANRDFYDHVNPDGEEPTDRANRNGYDCTVYADGYVYVGIAENIAMEYAYHSYYDTEPRRYNWDTPEDVAHSLEEAWMDSPGHRENILGDNYSKIGIGIALDLEDYSIYATQNFC